jgi:metabolite-proton symporter
MTAIRTAVGAQPRTGRLATASIVGTTLEYYDFAVYNTLAALVFGQLFFPSFDPLSGTLLAFSTYAVGYLSRPVGGLLFGHLGDRFGRRFVLVATLLLMGLTTVLIGFLPTYATAGNLSPILLVLLRFVQGAALGGEWAGAVLLSVEHGHAKQRGRNGSWAQMGPSLGTLLATGTIALLSLLVSAEDFLQWGWRLPFFASVALVAFGLWVRTGVAETPVFDQLKQSQKRTASPLREVVRGHWRSLLRAGGLRLGPDVLYSLIAAFTLSYLTTVLGLSRTLALIALSIGGACNAVAIPVFGNLSDHFGRRAVYAAGIALALVWAWMLFPLLDTKDPPIIIAAVTSGLIIHAMMYGPQAAFITEQFPTHVRYAGSSMAYTLAGVVGGGIAPAVFTSLLRTFQQTEPIALYATAALVVTGIAVACCRETQ